MERFFSFLIVVLALLAGGDTWAAGSCTVSIFTTGNPTLKVVTFAWTGDATSGSVPNTAMPGGIAAELNGWYAFKALTISGTPAPTNLYDITLEDVNGIDIFAGALMNRSRTAAEATPAVVWPLEGPLTLKITNQTDAGAKGTLKVYFSK